MPAPTVFNPATRQMVHGAAITNPAGGVTIDTQARTAANGILDALRDAGVIAGATNLNVGHVSNPARPGQIVAGPAIGDPAGGTADAEVRTSIVGILNVLRANGIIAGGAAGPALVLDEDTRAWASTAVANPTGGGTIDAECRTAITSALAGLRSSGLIAQD